MASPHCATMTFTIKSGDPSDDNPQTDRWILGLQSAIRMRCNINTNARCATHCSSRENVLSSGNEMNFHLEGYRKERNVKIELDRSRFDVIVSTVRQFDDYINETLDTTYEKKAGYEKEKKEEARRAVGRLKYQSKYDKQDDSSDESSDEPTKKAPTS
ncbi:hypothetical protein CC78DRAFT_582512 [Lojkania enalia]|uniref:Uncharacterized protein n=1 Tax=Lojkania enalia TaxID=147567 RepID=A0A9P4K5M0_9PLEO|nr:hypothetical protein CC78DRAFT_582512 [Didymosphaeria enalia]